MPMQRAIQSQYLRHGFSSCFTPAFLQQKARGLTLAQVNALINEHIQGRFLMTIHEAPCETKCQLCCSNECLAENGTHFAEVL